MKAEQIEAADDGDRRSRDEGMAMSTNLLVAGQDTTLGEVLRAVIAARPGLAGDGDGLALVAATGASPAAIPVDFAA